MAGLAFVLSILFSVLSAPCARYFYTIDVIRTIFDAKTELPDVLERDTKVSPAAGNNANVTQRSTEEDKDVKKINLTCCSHTMLCFVTQCCCCCTGLFKLSS